MNTKSENINTEKIAEILSTTIHSLFEKENIQRDKSEFSSTENLKSVFEKLTSWISLTGNDDLKLYLSLDYKAANIVSIKMFGIELDDDPENELYSECAKELLNIIVGNSLENLEGTNLQITSVIPGYINHSNKKLAEKIPSEMMEFKIGDGSLKIIII